MALQETLSELSGAGVEPARRLEAVRSLGEVRYAPAIPELLRLALNTGPTDLRVAAFAALQAYDDPAIGPQIVSAWTRLPDGLHPAALNLLASRAVWSRDLVSGVAAGTIPAASISADLRERLNRFPEPELRQALAITLPAPTPRVNQELLPQIGRLKSILSARPGDPYRGEPLYSERCAACHTLFFKGGRIGPDLTAYQRDDLGTLLPSILNPNAEIREGFENVVITTRDGRVLNGFLADQDAQLVFLRGLDGTDLALPRPEILTLEPAGRSLMPEGLLDGWTDTQLQDFFAYLRQSQPITR